MVRQCFSQKVCFLNKNAIFGPNKVEKSYFKYRDRFPTLWTYRKFCSERTDISFIELGLIELSIFLKRRGKVYRS